MNYTTVSTSNSKEYNTSSIAPFNSAGTFFKYANCRNLIKYRPNQTVICEGDHIDYFYEVMNGTLKSYKILKDGRRLITGFYTTGDVIGCPTDYTFFQSVECITKTTLCCYSRPQIEEIIRTHSSLSQKVIKVFYQQLNDAYEQMMSLGRKKPDECIATFLLNCGPWSISQIPSQKIMLHLPMSRLDIADYLGLRQETVCRILSKFKHEGLITLIQANQIILEDRKALSKIANLSEE